MSIDPEDTDGSNALMEDDPMTPGTDYTGSTRSVTESGIN